MKGATHIGAGAVCGIAISTYANLPPEQAVVATVCSMVASILPDLDSGTSIIGRVFLPVSWLVNQLFGHRTIFHALLPWSLILGLLWLAFPQYPWYLLASAVGIASHLALDLLNHAGVPLLWPIKAKLAIGVCRSGGMIDKMLGRIFPAVAGLLLIAYVAQLVS